MGVFLLSSIAMEISARECFTVKKERWVLLTFAEIETKGNQRESLVSFGYAR